MKNARHRIILAAPLFVILSALISAQAQITPSQDASADSSKPIIEFRGNDHSRRGQFGQFHSDVLHPVRSFLDSFRLHRFQRR